nr:alpha-L-fucosidase [Streptococcus sp. S784/96/1]
MKTITMAEIKQVANQGPYYPNWESLFQYQVPEWYQQAKFGIFVHWGLYSIPAFNNEWYSRNMYIQSHPEYKHHIETYGPQKNFGYKDFIPLFTAEKFNPKEWVSLFKKAGARYLFPVAEHHDGFQLYRSHLSQYNSVAMGPMRDILGELKREAEKEELHFCTSSHRAEHQFFFGHGKEFDSDVNQDLKKGDFYWPAMPEPDNQDLFSQPYPTREFLDDWLLRTCELIKDYQPEMLYFDWWIQHDSFKEYLQLVAAYFYNLGVEWEKPTSICYKHDAMMFGTGIVEVERGGFSQAQAFHWQTDTAIARNSWCYTTTLDYKTPREIIQTLIDVVAKNGNLLLNVGPKGDGSIPHQDEQILTTIGNWLTVNGEGIYASRPWRKAQEGPTNLESGQFSDGKVLQYSSKDFRFTVKGSAIYVFVMGAIEPGEQLTIQSLGASCNQNTPEFHGIIEEVSLLGYFEKLSWHQTKEGLMVDFPHKLSDLPSVIKVKIK